MRVIRCENPERRSSPPPEDYAGRAIGVNLVFATVDSLTFFFMNAVESAIYWVGADR